MNIQRLAFSPAVIAAAALLLTGGSIAIVTLTGIPLGVSGDWVWQRLDPPTPLPLSLAVILAVGGMAAFCCDRRASGRRPLLLALLFLCGFAADWLVLDGGRAGLAENVLAPLDRFTTGYLQPALTAPWRPDDAAANTRQLLTVPATEYPAHSHVHPPANWFLTSLVHQWAPDAGHRLLPSTARLVDTTQLWLCAAPPANTPEAADTALKLTWLFWAALETGKALVAAALLMLRPHRPGLALLPVVFGSGAAVLFLGHYDTLYFGLTAAALAAITAACRFRCASGAAAGGLILGGGAFFSLGFGAPIAVAAAALTAGFRGMRRQQLLASLLAGLMMAGIAGWWIFQVPPWELALTCWRNHRIFNDMADRRYLLWLPYQILDALLFCGPLAALMPLTALRGRYRHPLNACLLVILTGWLYLLFGGAAIGEFGRLTALYLPLLLFAAGVAGGRDRIFAKPIPYACFALTAMGAMVLTAVLRSTLKLVIVDGGGW